MSIKKQQVYDFLNRKEAEVMKEKVRPLEEKWSESKKTHRELVLASNGVRNEEFEESAKNIVSSLEKLRDNLDYSNGNINVTISTLKSLTQDGKTLEWSINYDSVSCIDESYRKFVNTRKEVNTEFKKITRAVRSLRTGKQAVDFLNKLGFDASGIKPEPKKEVAILKVDSDLLGLPESKEQESGVLQNA